MKLLLIILFLFVVDIYFYTTEDQINESTSGGGRDDDLFGQSLDFADSSFMDKLLRVRKFLVNCIIIQSHGA